MVVFGKVNMNELGVLTRVEMEVERLNKFQNMILLDKNPKRKTKPVVDMRVYAK